MRAWMSLMVVALFASAPCWAENTVSNSLLTLSVNPQNGTWSCPRKDRTPIFKGATETVVTSQGVLKTIDDRFLRKAEESTFQDALDSGRQITLFLDDLTTGLKWTVSLKSCDQFASIRVNWHLDNSARAGRSETTSTC